MTSPTQRTLERLRDTGWEPDVVERLKPQAAPPAGWIDSLAVAAYQAVAMLPVGPVRSALQQALTDRSNYRDERMTFHLTTKVDLYNGIDVVAIREGIPGILGIQCTTSDNTAARRNKLLAEPRMKLWIECGNKLQIWGWRKVRVANKTRPGFRELWEPEIDVLKVSDFTKPF